MILTYNLFQKLLFINLNLELISHIDLLLLVQSNLYFLNLNINYYSTYFIIDILQYKYYSFLIIVIIGARKKWNDQSLLPVFASLISISGYYLCFAAFKLQVIFWIRVFPIYTYIIQYVIKYSFVLTILRTFVLSTLILNCKEI